MKFDGGRVIKAAAAADLSIGVTDRIEGPAAGDEVDVALAGIALVTFGGAVNPGERCTSDATGRAVKAAGGNMVVGISLLEKAAAAGDVGPLLLSPGVM